MMDTMVSNINEISPCINEYLLKVLKIETEQDRSGQTEHEVEQSTTKWESNWEALF